VHGVLEGFQQPSSENFVCSLCPKGGHFLKKPPLQSLDAHSTTAWRQLKTLLCILPNGTDHTPLPALGTPQWFFEMWELFLPQPVWRITCMFSVNFQYKRAWITQSVYRRVTDWKTEVPFLAPSRLALVPTQSPLQSVRTILKLIWTYGIQLWGTASISNIDILERFQLKALRMIVDAPWYVLNTLIRRDLQVPSVKEEIRRYSSQYSAHLSAHPNDLIVSLIELPDNRRLWRHLANDLPTKFLV
jgi:hypothetical protein